MPTLLRWRGYRFFLKRSAEAKVWLDPVQLQVAVDFRGHEINALMRKVHEQRDVFLRAWHDHFRA